MRLPAYVLVFALGILLATTTPIGTGGGVHQFDLVHPLFSHVHLINGRVLSHDQLADAASAQPVKPGVNLGAGEAASAAEGGIGLSPTLPVSLLVSPRVLTAAVEVAEQPIPRGTTEAPPDPPPL